MTEFFDAIDNYTAITSQLGSSQLGENGHTEYKWSEHFEEKIVQFHFQLVRTKSSHQLSVLADVLRGLLRTLLNEKPSGPIDSGQVNQYLTVLYCMLAQTRDVVDGKGEYQLSYMMLLVWYEFFPVLALYALETFVHSPMDNQTKVVDSDFHPYGSWKDMKYFANYCKSQGCSDTHPLIQRIISLINTQLHIDNQIVDEFTTDKNTTKNTLTENTLTVNTLTERPISLVAKWTPRQSSSQFGWLNKLLAMNYFKEIMATAVVKGMLYKSQAQYTRAQDKCFMLYRKMLSKLNHRIDTIQIKQCGHNWSSIDHAKTTSITFIKQSKALYNVDKKGQQRSSESDRIECADQLKAFVAERVKLGKEIKGGRVGMADFTKKARALIASRTMQRHDETCLSEIALLNSQWRDSSSLTGSLSNFVAMVDVSDSMEGDPMDVAISLGIRVAEKSTLGKRVMTFSSNPTWVRLSGDYIDMVEQTSKAEWGTGTDFYKALDLILTACVQSRVGKDVVAKMVLVIFSDMQIGQGDSGYKSMQDGIKQKYKDAGYDEVPHILFWNLRSTSGFPTLMSEPNVSAMSGFSPALLNAFCEKGVEGLASANPWDTLLISLYKDRYGQMIQQI